MGKKTPLFETHKKLGAKMAEFAGWEMPIQYSGIIEEHEAVRTKAGIFDVSHMGQITIKGPKATETIQELISNDIERIPPGQAQYSGMLDHKGHFIDDIIVYKKSPQDYMICVNASNIDKDFEWMKKVAAGRAEVKNVSDKYALLAIQGPKAISVVEKGLKMPLNGMKSFQFQEAEIFSVHCLMAKTGYTGEDGFEIFLNPADAPKLWEDLLKRGKDEGLVPVGLGARDTLRLEACYSLYGHEIGPDTNPIEANLSWTVKLNKPFFIGKEALEKAKAEGPAKKLVGIQMIEQGIPRQGYPIYKDNQKVGEVTSGTFSPTFRRPIALGYVPSAIASEGNEIEIDIRGKKRKAMIVSTPFYKRKKP